MVGRPAFQPTDEHRRDVAAWAVARVAKTEMAKRLGLTKPTLVKHFASELGVKPKTTGQLKKRNAPVAEFPLLDGIPTNAVRAVQPVVHASPEVPGAFRPNSRQREEVSILAGYNVPVDKIAAHLGLDTAVVKEHFATELDGGSGKCTCELVLSIHRAGRGGNPSMAKLGLTIVTALAGTKGKDEEEEPKDTLSTAQIGKKVAAQNAAESAGVGTEWGDDLQLPGLKLVKG